MEQVPHSQDNISSRQKHQRRRQTSFFQYNSSNKARRFAGKHVMLTTLEISSSWMIWTILFLPSFLLTLWYLFIWLTPSSSHQIFSDCLSATSPYYQLGACSFLTTPFPAYINDAQSYLLLQIQQNQTSSTSTSSSNSLNWPETLLEVQSLYISSNNNQTIELSNWKFDPFVFVTDSNVVSNPIPSTSISIMIPLPYIDIDHQVGHSQLSTSWQLVYHIKIFSDMSLLDVIVDPTDQNQENNQIMKMSLETQSSSFLTIIWIIIQSIIISIVSFIFLIVFSQRIWEYAIFALNDVRQELPHHSFIHDFLSTWKFILPEQYFCLFGLFCLSGIHGMKSIALILSVWSIPKEEQYYHTDFALTLCINVLNYGK
jgi:hypothetical protein